MGQPLKSRPIEISHISHFQKIDTYSICSFFDFQTGTRIPWPIVPHKGSFYLRYRFIQLCQGTFFWILALFGKKLQEYTKFASTLLIGFLNIDHYPSNRGFRFLKIDQCWRAPYFINFENLPLFSAIFQYGFKRWNPYFYYWSKKSRIIEAK